MLAKWAEDDRQEKIKAEQRRQRMLEYRHLCNQLDTERHKQLIADKVSSVCVCVCVCVCVVTYLPAIATHINNWGVNSRHCHQLMTTEQWHVYATLQVVPPPMNGTSHSCRFKYSVRMSTSLNNVIKNSASLTLPGCCSSVVHLASKKNETWKTMKNWRWLLADKVHWAMRDVLCDEWCTFTSHSRTSMCPQSTEDKHCCCHVEELLMKTLDLQPVISQRNNAYNLSVFGYGKAR